MNQNNDPKDDGDLIVRVYDEGGNEVAITGILINGTALVTDGVIDTDGVASNDPNNPNNLNDNTVTATTSTASGLGFELHGLGGGTGGQDGDNDTVTIITDSGYSRIDISGIGNDASKDTFDILLQSVAVPTPFDIAFQTQADLTDEDGDTTEAADLNVTLEVPSQPITTLTEDHSTDGMLAA